MTYKRGDVVLALFPDSNLRTAKPRPVLVVLADNLSTGLENVIRQVLARRIRRCIQSTLMPRGFRLPVRGCRPSYRSLLVTL